MDASLLYLGAQALQTLDLTPRAVCDALAEAFARHAASGFIAPPKQTLALGRAISSSRCPSRRRASRTRPRSGWASPAPTPAGAWPT